MSSSVTATFSNLDVLKSPNPPKHPRIKIIYDIGMLILIVLDLLSMGIDALLMSSFMLKIAAWFSIVPLVTDYQMTLHPWIKTIGGFFTLFLITELLIRWVIAIVERRYYRWFFFPFIHWYEVLGCAPQLRALRLLRAVVTGYRLHQLGYQVLPTSWLKTGKFYYDVIMEEISDRVILTAIENIRTEIAHADGHLIHDIIDKHRDELEAVIMLLLQQEVTPLLQSNADTPPLFAKPLADQVGVAIQQSLMDTPELRRALRMIPIAGSLIENQLMNLGQHLGENLTMALSQSLTHPVQLERLYRQIATQVAQVDTTNPALEKLISTVIDESLTALANQVKIQQWKHKSHP